LGTLFSLLSLLSNLDPQESRNHGILASTNCEWRALSIHLPSDWRGEKELPAFPKAGDYLAYDSREMLGRKKIITSFSLSFRDIGACK